MMMSAPEHLTLEYRKAKSVADPRPISVLLTFVTRMMRHQPGIVGIQDAALSQLDSSWQPFAMGLLPLLWCIWERLPLYSASTRWRGGEPAASESALIGGAR